MIVNLDCQLDIRDKKELQLKKELLLSDSPVGMSVCHVLDAGGPDPLWAIPSLGS